MSQFKELAKRHSDRVYSLACYMLRDRDDAADVTQEVLLSLWHNMERLDTERLEPWLVRVTRNACIDAVRKRKRHNHARLDDDESNVGEMVSAEPLPDVVAEGSQIQDMLMDAVSRLQEPYRSIVVCRSINEMKYQEIADALELPLSTVKVYLYRARKMLREDLAERVEYVPTQ